MPDYEPSLEEVENLIEDFATDFEVTLPIQDAKRILILYEELCRIFDSYTDGKIPPHLMLDR